MKTFAWLRYLVVLAVIGISLFISIRGALFTIEWPPPEYSNPTLVNLTRTEIVWDVAYDLSPKCGAVDCFVTVDHPASAFAAHKVLPNRYYGSERDARSGVMYYRARFSVPRNLVDEQRPVAFHFLRLYSQTWEMFINGESVHHGSGKIDGGLEIPARFLKAGPEITIAFKLETKNVAEPGFDIRADLLVAAEDEVRAIAARGTAADARMVLWFVIPRFAMAILFGVGCLFFPYYLEALSFVVMCLFAGLYILALNGGAGLPSIGGLDPWLALNSADYLSCVALLAFIGFFLRDRSRAFRWALGGALALFPAYVILTMTVLTSQDSLALGYTLAKTLQAFVVFYGIWIAIVTARALRLMKRSRFRYVVALVLGGLLAVALPFVVARAAGVRELWIGSHLWHMVFTLVAGGCVAAEWGMVAIDREKLMNRFRMIIDERFAGDFFFKPELAATNRDDVTILFTDIRSFTTLSEVFPAEDVVRSLNEYLDIVTQVVHEHNGVVDKFVGDAVMAVWGIPEKRGDEATQAVRAGMEIRRRVGQLNAVRRSAGDFEVRVGIGIHRGGVIFGPIGNSERVDYTVIGPAVNIASRIEQETKRLKADFLVSDEIWRDVADLLVAVDCGSLQMRGSQRWTRIYRVIGVVRADGSGVDTHDEVLAKLNLDPSVRLLAEAPPNLEALEYESEPDSREAASA